MKTLNSKTAVAAAKLHFGNVFKTIDSEYHTYELSEAAIPAYAHKNFLIKSVFWNRIRKAIDLIPVSSSNLLDFGCGTGIASYVAEKMGLKVTAIDLNLNPYKMVSRKIEFGPAIEFLEASIDVVESKLPLFDAIIALDVFEHIENIDSVVQILKTHLRIGGVLIVSLPTESSLYRLGRKIAGKKFTGAYHVSNAARVEAVLSKHLTKSEAIDHPFGLNLFRIIRFVA